MKPDKNVVLIRLLVLNFTFTILSTKRECHVAIAANPIAITFWSQHK